MYGNISMCTECKPYKTLQIVRSFSGNTFQNMKKIGFSCFSNSSMKMPLMLFHAGMKLLSYLLYLTKF